MIESTDSDANSLTPFQVALWNWFVLLALVFGFPFAVLLTFLVYLPLLGFPVDAYLGPYREVNVARMIERGDDVYDVARVMEKRPACVFTDQINGKSLLTCAVESGHVPLVEYALQLGADVDGGYLEATVAGIESKKGTSPIQIAKERRLGAIVSILVDATREH